MKFRYSEKKISSKEITKAIWTLVDGKDRNVSNEVIEFVKPYFEKVEKRSGQDKDGNYYLSHVFYELSKQKTPPRKKYYQVYFKESGEIISYDQKTLISLDNSEENLGTKGSWINRVDLPYENEKIIIREVVVLTRTDVRMKKLFIRLVEEGVEEVKISSAAEIIANDILIKYSQGYNLRGERFAKIGDVIDFIKKLQKK